MTKILKVIKPFFVMEVGDTFEYDAETKQYKSVYNEEHNSSNEDSSTIVSTYNSVYTISEDYAKLLIEGGYIEEVKTENKQFVNIFDEIGRLIVKYSEDLNELINSTDDAPQCLKVEKETVLRNMLKLLHHLESLKK